MGRSISENGRRKAFEAGLRIELPGRFPYVTKGSCGKTAIIGRQPRQLTARKTLLFLSRCHTGASAFSFAFKSIIAILSGLVNLRRRFAELRIKNRIERLSPRLVQNDQTEDSAVCLDRRQLTDEWARRTLCIFSFR